MEQKEKPIRQLALRVIIIEILLFVVTMPWYMPRWTDHFSWIICVVLVAYTAWKDHQQGTFDRRTIVYIAISAVICAALIILILSSSSAAAGQP